MKNKKEENKPVSRFVQPRTVPYSKRERRTAKHIAFMTPTMLENLTATAEICGVSRNEAITQAVTDWMEEREETPKGKAKITFAIDERKYARLQKHARLQNKPIEEMLREIVLTALDYEEHERKNRLLRERRKKAKADKMNK